MIICICSNYNSASMVEDVTNDKTLKEIIAENDICNGCKKCCLYIKQEYKTAMSEIKGVNVSNIEDD